MKVRVYDKLNDKYFKSDVYAQINRGFYERQLVLVPSEKGAYIKFFDYLDKGTTMPYKVLINTITHETPSEWICKESGSPDKHLEGYRKILDRDMKFFDYIGYPWIIENKSLMSELLSGKEILLQGSIFENNTVSSNMPGWNYIETQEDIENAMEQAHSFHDSVMKELHYTSGSYVDRDGAMQPVANLRKVVMQIESQWCDPIEMVFEGVTALNLRPAGDNYTSDMWEASICLKNNIVFFCDGELSEMDEAYEGTWVTAYSLRWRFTQ
jgi:hypothetical protein